MRQEADGTTPHRPTKGKVIGDSFSTDGNSKTKSRGIKGGGWILHRTHISRSWNQKTSLTTCGQKRLPGGQRGVMSWDIPRIHLGKEMQVPTWGDPKINQVRTVKQANHNDWPKETRKKCPHESNSSYYKGMTQQFRDSPSESACVYPQVMYSFYS